MSLHGERTLFGRIPEKNVYFLIDTSGSMYHQLGFVKSHLIEVITRRAVFSPDSMFNIIQFKEDTNKWADRLVQCTPEMVNVASRWVTNLTCGTSTDTMTALLQAFSDPATEAVHMITDGQPDQRAAVILETLSSMSCGVPVHCVYLKGTYSDPAACEFLRDLAEQTRGSFHAVKLSQNGKVEQVIPICSSKTVQHYADDVSFPSKSIQPYLDINTRPTSGYINTTYDNSVRSQPGASLVPLPRVPHKDPILDYSSSNGFDSKVLDYAEALIKTRDLAQSAGIRCSSTPVASSVMKGVKVLARHDRDGMYYLGQVKEQGPNDTFVIKFESCPAMRKTGLHEISVYNMIAYKDAVRLNISLGDKVLAPWQQDGRYGPGTVLDGFERRDTQNQSDDDDELLVTFFNGQTASLPHGVAIRLPQKKFDRISSDLQLPESQRRKQKLRDEINTTASAYDSCNSRARPKTMWQEERHDLLLENEKLKRNIEAQMKENGKLLSALDLNIGNVTKPREPLLLCRATSRDLKPGNLLASSRNSPVIGKATSRDLLKDYDSGVFSDEDSAAYTEDTTDRTATYSEMSQFDVGVDTYYKDYDLAFTPPRFSLLEREVLSKSDDDIKPKKPWQYSSGGVSAKQPRSRETVLAKPREPGEKLTERPTHEDYKTVAGVSFPARTDRKFGTKPQKWHPYRQFGDAKSKETISVIWERKHLKHSEYQDVSGVKFPSSTDKKFTRSLDVNWSPDTALRNASRSSDWEEGLGHGDAEKNARYANKLERMRSNKRTYFKDIEDKVAIEEGKEDKRIEFRRNKTTARKEDMAETNAEQNRQKAERMETMRAKQAEIIQHEKGRTEKAEKWKTDRIEALKERQVKFAEIEDGHETKNDSKKARREAYLRVKENERREEFHEKLREEWRTEDERAEQLRRRNEAGQEKQSIRKLQADRAKQARLAAKQERMDRCRASILP